MRDSAKTADDRVKERERERERERKISLLDLTNRITPPQILALFSLRKRSRAKEVEAVRVLVLIESSVLN